MNTGATCAHPSQRNPLRIPSEVFDILVYPLEGHILVLQAHITRHYIIPGAQET